MFLLHCPPMRRLSFLIVAVLALALAIAAPAGAAAQRAQSQPLQIGLQDDQVFVQQNLLSPQNGYNLASQLGASRLRINLGWAGVVGDTANDAACPARCRTTGATSTAPSTRPPPTACTSSSRCSARSRLGPAPATASRPTSSPTRGCSRSSPAPPPSTSRAVSTATRSGTSPTTRAGSTRTQRAAAVPQALHRRLQGHQAVDPTAQVLLGETSPIGRSGVASSPLTFLRQITCSKPDYTAAKNCEPLRLDGYAHHPYTLLSGTAYGPYFPGLTNDDVTTGSLVRLDQALDKLQQRGALINTGGGTNPVRSPISLYLTEYGFYARGKTSTTTLPENQRAAYLRKGFQLAMKDPRVKLVVQYLLAPQSPLYSFDTSLVEKDGTPDDAFNALAAWIQQIEAAGKIQVPVPFVLPPAPPW